MTWCNIFGVCMLLHPDWTSLWLESRCTVHRGIESIYLTYFWWMIPCLTFLFWVWFESRFLWIIFDLITFWSSFAAESGLARRSGDSARPGRVPASLCSPPAQCHLKEEWMTWFTNFLFKWISSEDLFLSTQTPDKWKALTRSCGCNVNMSAGRASI